jgi:hypothetical protein
MPNCEMHDTVMESFRAGTDRMKGIEVKLDCMMERQVDMIREIAYVKSAIDNGLRKQVLETAKTCSDLADRMKPLEGFSWFRLWMTDARDNIFKYVIFASLFVGGLFAILHFGDTFIQSYIKR